MFVVHFYLPKLCKCLKSWGLVQKYVYFYIVCNIILVSKFLLMKILISHSKLLVQGKFKSLESVYNNS